MITTIKKQRAFNLECITTRMADFQEEIQFQVLRRLHQTPEVSQRALARELGISLGSINYCFQALVEKGWVKVQNFSRNEHKLGYIYLLTPTGISRKSRLTAEFLRRKVIEYETLREEIEQLKADLSASVKKVGN
jgi:EPS-associated MarR family transcriptional regulator